ncbi:phage tail protein [Pseudomonas sp. SCB32]|uniref:phage tail-collar fiber domain-containing protein n=1 Tax=Pseudomonas sp. SCB32 TaxID=2653853 RepID=UPI0012642666|nr:phage tail protein [Pseudomonas sp. SCB32]
MSASITLAGESLIAQKQAAQQPLQVARFVLANVPGLNPNAPVDRAASKPPAAQIVHTAAVTRAGYVNPRQVIYSLMIGSDIGDWDFNWIGLESAENVLLAVAYVPVQQKRKNIPPLQIGNNITRNFLVEFNGAQQLTGISVDASTWQHDFTVRLAGIDQRERLSNRDIFGRACFLADSLQLERMFGAYQLKAGVAYIEGVRVVLPEAIGITIPSLPSKVWIDVALVRQASDVVVSWAAAFGANLVDYSDTNGVRHYLVPIADVTSSTAMADLRASQPITGALVQHFAARVGDYAQLRARATTKVDVGLGNLPNAKSDDPDSDSSDVLATTKALKAMRALVDSAQVGLVGMFPMGTPPAGWLRANGAAVSRTVFAALFARIGTAYGPGDGSTTFNLPDYRGLFPRFWDDGRGIDAGRGLGTFQDGAIQSHGHTARSDGSGAHTHNAWTAVAGEHAHYVRTGRVTPDSIDWSGYEEPRNLVNYGEDGYNDKLTSSGGSHNHQVGVDAVAHHSHTITVDPTGGGETRPRNIALLACIKY